MPPHLPSSCQAGPTFFDRHFIGGAQSPQSPSIGLALSGGGVRAAVFHLGVLGQLATDGLLERVKMLSTVSGGSLISALIFSLADNRWPSSDQFLAEVLPQSRSRLTDAHSIQKELLTRFAWRPWRMAARSANQLADSLRSCWHIETSLSDLPVEPRWIINATTYETGKNWRFIPGLRMGDYSIGYALAPHLPVADAVAASAAVPGLIGAYRLRTGAHEWFTFDGAQPNGLQDAGSPVTVSDAATATSRPDFDVIHLWDGSVYDFLGTEPLFKIGASPLPAGINVLLVSDASNPIGTRSASDAAFVTRGHRLITIATDQVRSLRTRSMVDYFRQFPGSGAFLKLGTDCTKWTQQEEIFLPKSELTLRDIEWAANMETSLRQLSAAEFDLLFQHGLEIAAANLRTFLPQIPS